MQNSLKILTLALILCLAGCVTTYKLNTKGPTAELGFLDLYSFKNSNSLFIFGDPYKCKLEQLVPRNKVIQIPANRLITILSRHMIGYLNLNFVVSFIPKQNYVYLIKTQNHVGFTTVGVNFSILAKDKKSLGGYEKLPFVGRTYVEADHIENSTSFCSDKLIQNQLLNKPYSKIEKVYQLNQADDHAGLFNAMLQR